MSMQNWRLYKTLFFCDPNVLGAESPKGLESYNPSMRFSDVLYVTIFACSLASAQDKAPVGLKSVTVPMIVDHDRIVIDVDIPLAAGKSERVHAWVDNWNPEFEMSQRLAELLGSVMCNGQVCSASPPKEISIGGMSIPVGGGTAETRIKEAKVDRDSIAPGLHVEMNIPSTLLRHYDVLVDFPGHQFTIGEPSTIPFRGPSSKVLVNARNGLIQVPSQIENKKYNLALDLGSSISFLSAELFDKLSASHPDWPHMIGTVGPANMWGQDAEISEKLMRLDRLQFGPLFLTNVAIADFPKDRQDFFVQRAGIPTAGLLASQALHNYRVGLDYAHSMVHFEIGRTFNFPDFDVVGLILRPENDGRYTILGVADAGDASSVSKGTEGAQPGDVLVAVNEISVSGSTMGQVWSMLGGTPGQERKLTLERSGKQLTIVAQVQHFLGEAPDDSDSKKKNKTKK
jgi:hypothetical protein